MDSPNKEDIAFERFLNTGERAIALVDQLLQAIARNWIAYLLLLITMTPVSLIYRGDSCPNTAIASEN